jgi:uncharacterized repeat protein (TIGR03803 family)
MTRPRRYVIRSVSIAARTAAVALALTIVFALTVGFAPLVQAQTYQVLHRFTNGGDGAYPYAGLTPDRAGNLYGTTTEGGHGYGTVFRLSRAGSGWLLSPLYMFQGGADGVIPYGGVVFGPDGALYGTTSNGGLGCGTVFRLAPLPTACTAAFCLWTETVLYRFSGPPDGALPGYGNLVFDQAGSMYGTTIYGGVGNYGVVFELSPSAGGWTETVIFDFTNSLMSYPESGLTFDSAGNLYGTTLLGNRSNGAVYELSPSPSGWTAQTLSQLNIEGAGAVGGVTMDPHGNLFGTAGEEGPGGVYELSPSNGNWMLDVLYVWTSGFDGPQDTPTLDAEGNVYGTSNQTGAHELGQIFELSLSGSGWVFNDLHDFRGSDGAYPIGGVTFDATGNMYGTAAGGAEGGFGVVWEVTP